MFQVDEEYLDHLRKASQHPLIEAAITLHQAWTMGRTIECDIMMGSEVFPVSWAKDIYPRYLVQTVLDLMIYGFTICLYRDSDGNVAEELGLLPEYPGMALMRTRPRKLDVERYNKLFSPSMRADCKRAFDDVCDVCDYVPERLDPCNVVVFYETDDIGTVLQMYVIPKSVLKQVGVAVDREFVVRHAMKAVRVHLNEKTLADNQVSQGSGGNTTSSPFGGHAHLMSPGKSMGKGRAGTKLDGKKTVFSEVAATLRPLNIVADMELRLSDLTWVAGRVPYAMVNDGNDPKQPSVRDMLGENIAYPLVEAFERARGDTRNNNFFEGNKEFRSKFLEHTANNIVTSRRGLVPYDMRVRQATGELTDYKEFYNNMIPNRRLHPMERAKNTLAGPSPWHDQLPYFCFQGTKPEFMPVKDLNRQHIELYQMFLDNLTDVFGIPLSFLRQDNRAVSANGRQDRTLKTSRHYSNEKNEYISRCVEAHIFKTCLDICKPRIDMTFFKAIRQASFSPKKLREKLRSDLDEGAFPLRRQLYRSDSRASTPGAGAEDEEEEDDDDDEEDPSQILAELEEELAKILKGNFRVRVAMINSEGVDLDALVKVHAMNLLPPDLLRKKAAVATDLGYELEELEKSGFKDMPNGIPIEQLAAVESVKISQTAKAEAATAKSSLPTKRKKPASESSGSSSKPKKAKSDD